MVKRIKITIKKEKGLFGLFPKNKKKSQDYIPISQEGELLRRYK